MQIDNMLNNIESVKLPSKYARILITNKTINDFNIETIRYHKTLFKNRVFKMSYRLFGVVMSILTHVCCMCRVLNNCK